MEDTRTELPSTITVTAVPRACDACRSRKIRCSREIPCSHCLQAKIDCTSNQDNRPKEKRARILLSSQYEKKIDHIDRRLDGIVRLLADLKLQLPGVVQPSKPASPEPTISHPATAASSSFPPSLGVSDGHDESSGLVVEGDSSLTAHSVFANNLLQKLVDQDADLELRDTLETLRHLVDAMKKQPAAYEMTYPNVKAGSPSASEAFRQCELPPIQQTVQMLNLAKGGRVTPRAWICDVFPLHTLPEKCMSVYFSNTYSVAEFIIVNAGLSALFFVFGQFLPLAETKEYKQFSLHCSRNTEIALAGLPLHLPATPDYITALLCGSVCAIELSKPSLSWVLTSKASELCQTLGYHRVETFKNDRPDDARHRQSLFWSVYVLDKGLSLRLGRGSTIQDYDVTLPYPSSHEPDRNAISAFMTIWIKAARIQGQIYERLYSPEALAQPENTRRARVQILAQNLDDLEILAAETTSKFNDWCRDSVGEDIARFFHASDHVMRLSLLTTVHRALPNPPGSPTTFNTECLQAARATLELHQECVALNEKANLGLFASYMNWTILFAPFVPVIVLFCQVIETCDLDDLARIQTFVASMSSDSDSENEAIVKLRRLFQVLCSVAQHYVNSSIVRGENATSSVVSNVDGLHEQLAIPDGIDAYLATLGLPVHFSMDQDPQDHHQQPHKEPTHEQPGSTTHTNGPEDNLQTTRAVNPMLWMGNGMQLEDWFYNSQQMLDFLDDGDTGPQR